MTQDDYWTTQTQPGNPYKDNPNEPNWQLQVGWINVLQLDSVNCWYDCFLQAIVVTLSVGPNGPSDMVGGTNKSLVRPSALVHYAVIMHFLVGR